MHRELRTLHHLPYLAGNHLFVSSASAVTTRPSMTSRDVVRPMPADAPAIGMPQAVRIEPLAQEDVASAVALAVRVLRVKPGDLGEQFASDIADELRQMFVAKANGRVVGYGRGLKLAADEAGPGTPAVCYLSGVLVDPVWRGRGIAMGLTRARLRWAFARTGTVFYVAGADNAASFIFTRLSDSRKSSASTATGPHLASTCCRSW